jgi:hypothetical protein
MRSSFPGAAPRALQGARLQDSGGASHNESPSTGRTDAAASVKFAAPISCGVLQL